MVLFAPVPGHCLLVTFNYFQLCGIVSCFNKSIDSNCLFSKILIMRRNHITCGLTLKRHQHEGHVYIVEHKNTDQVDQLLCCDLPI